MRAERFTYPEIAKRLGRTRHSVQFKFAREARVTPSAETQRPFTVAEALPTTLDADQILDHKERLFENKERCENERQLIGIDVHLSGPIAIAHFGDPHIDDDGCDVKRLRRDIATVKATEGMFGANAGDYHNNWVGRLQALYANQHTTRDETFVLIEWLFKEIEWLYLIGGNHDYWQGGNEILGWLAKASGRRYEPWGARFALRFPNRAECRINARHDFKGSSQWNPTHGPMKAAMMGFGDGRDHIYTCGHKHKFGFSQFATGENHICTAIQVNAYKQFDPYARENNFIATNHAPCVVTVIDPEATNAERFVTVFTDVQEAAEYLTWKRERYAKAA